MSSLHISQLVCMLGWVKGHSDESIYNENDKLKFNNTVSQNLQSFVYLQTQMYI